MKQQAILHLCTTDKFIPGFIDFVRQNFDPYQHRFILIGGWENKYGTPPENLFNLFHYKNNKWLLVREVNKAKKIIIHGLFSIHLAELLALQPWLLKKCYWVIWGGDLYLKKNDFIEDIKFGLKWKFGEFWRTFVIRRFGHLVTHVKGDFKLARQWYGAKGEWHECFVYPSNLHHEILITQNPHKGTNILVGNSADPSNHHIDVLNKLLPYKSDDVRIYVPLSYGDNAYAETVVTYGQKQFGDKFIPLLNFIPFEKYLELLGEIDIALFNHRRQQGMGNITTLLGLGKKVYMRSDVTPWEFFNKLGVHVFDINQIDPAPLETAKSTKNRQIISSHFTKERLIQQLEGIFL